MTAGKNYVPERSKPVGYNVPPNNLCVQYMENCEKLKVNCNSLASRQLLNRVRQTQKLPYHLLVDKNRSELINLCFDHLDEDGNQTIDIDELAAFSKIVNPRAPVKQAAEDLKRMDTNGDNLVSREEFQQAMQMLWLNMSDEEIKQGVLEVLANANMFNELPSVGTKLRRVFKFLDADNSGFLELDELTRLGKSVNPRANLEQARELFEKFDTNKDNKISADEFVIGMEAMLEGQSDENITLGLTELMEAHMAHYDFSACYLGPQGLAAILPVLKRDVKCESISLRNCGLHNLQCELLYNTFKAHPTLKSLDLGSNPISDEGAEWLLALVQENQLISDMQLDDTPVMTMWYNRSPVLGDRLFHKGQPIMDQLAINKEKKVEPEVSMDMNAFLADHKDDVKILFYSLMGSDGTVNHLDLVDAMQEMGEQWGIIPAQMLKHLNPQRMFAYQIATGVTPASGDDEGFFPTTITYAEFVRALKHESKLDAIRRIFQAHKDEIKEIFYKHADEWGKLSYRDCIGVIWTEKYFGITAQVVAQAVTPTLFFGPSTVIGDQVHCLKENGSYEAIKDDKLSWSVFHNSINEEF